MIIPAFCFLMVHSLQARNIVRREYRSGLRDVRDGRRTPHSISHQMGQEQVVAIMKTSCMGMVMSHTWIRRVKVAEMI